MGRYVALLRGINVGGKNKVDMPGLAALFAQNGFTNVTTYINSGNVIFDSDAGDADVISAACAAMLAQRYPFEIRVAVFTAEELIAALDNAPAWWHSEAGTVNNAFFVIQPLTAQDVFAQVGEHRPAYEQVASHGRVIFWTAALKTYSRTKWSKIVQLPVYKGVTLRNANTAKRLAALMRQG